jgi:hypothetical protein
VGLSQRKPEGKETRKFELERAGVLTRADAMSADASIAGIFLAASLPSTTSLLSVCQEISRLNMTPRLVLKDLNVQRTVRTNLAKLRCPESTPGTRNSKAPLLLRTMAASKGLTFPSAVL